MGRIRKFGGVALAVLVIIVGACYESHLGAAEEDDARAADTPGDRPDLDDRGDGRPPGEDAGADDAGPDETGPDDGSRPDSGRDDAGLDDAADVPPTAHLEPESDWESYFDTESGIDVEVHSGWIVPAAFSGRVYEIVMDEDVPWATDDSFTAIYRLAPGGDRLERSWIDTEIDEVGYGSICWSGEAFVAALPSADGDEIRLLAVDEDARLLRDPARLPDFDGGGSGAVFCPSAGPLVLTHDSTRSLVRLHHLGFDGAPAGTHVDLSPLVVAGNHRLWACAEAGDEVACVTRTDEVTGEPARIVFLGRDGTVRRSPALPEPVACEDPNGCDLVFLGDGLGLVWSAEEGGKPILTYARTDRDGSLVVGPVSTARQIGRGPLGMHAATSGSTVFVVAEGAGGDRLGENPTAHLLALDGTTRGEALRVNSAGVGDFSSERPGFWRGMAVFWEGDAYSAIWNTWPNMMVAYRRFLVMP